MNYKLKIAVINSVVVIKIINRYVNNYYVPKNTFNFYYVFNCYFIVMFLKLFYSVLDVEAFERLLGPCMQIMKRNITDYETVLVSVFGSKQNIVDIR